MINSYSEKYFTECELSELGCLILSDKLIPSDLTFAVEIFGSRTDDHEYARKVLIPCLDHMEAAVRESALYGLGSKSEHLNERVVERIRLLVTSDSNQAVRTAASDLLEGFGWSVSEPQFREIEATTQVQNWGDYGIPIAKAQLNKVRELVILAARNGLRTPFVSPCEDGIVHLQWTTHDGKRGVIEVLHQCDLRWTYMDNADGSSDEIIDLSSSEELVTKVRELFVR